MCACSVGRCTTARPCGDAGSECSRAGTGGHRAGNAGLDQLDDPFVGEVARGREHDVGGLVVRVVIAGDAVAGHPLDGRFVAEHLATERVVGEVGAR